jgi:hypothetical protein
LRRLRIAGAAAQLSLHLPAGDEEPGGELLWAGLPDAAQAQLLVLCAQLIARTMMIEEVEQSSE